MTLLLPGAALALAPGLCPAPQSAPPPAPPAPGPAVAFVDVAAALGAGSIGFGRGAAFVDMDGDGRLDIVAADSILRLEVLRQEPDGTFQSAWQDWGLPNSVTDAWGVVAADLDGDRDPDLYLPRGGWSGPRTNILLRNDLDTLGVLTDVSGLGDAAVPHATFGATALDYDRDGDLDLFAANRGNAADGKPASCTLLRNDGGMVFTDVSVQAGIVQKGRHSHCSAGDLDNDGWPDIAVGSLNGNNRLYRNRGDGTFDEIAVTAGVASPTQNYGLVFEDFDNDGWMDLWSPKYHGVGEMFRNAGDGTFALIDVGMPAVTDMGHNTGDVDGDGYPDLFIGTGGPGAPVADVLLLVTPDGLGGFQITDVSASSGILASGPTRAHGCPFGDLDGDGDVDFFSNNGGPDWLPGTSQRSFLWQNQGNANRWIQLDLTGVLSNPSAVGARGRAKLPSGREVWRHVTAGKGFANTDAAGMHFGLGTTPAVDEIELTWPSGVRQVLVAPPLDAAVAVLETGFVVAGTATPGATIVVSLCGPAGAAVDLTAVLAPAGGGAGPPLGVPQDAVLGADGRLDVPIALPPNPALLGATLTIAATITPAGGGPATVAPAVVLILS